jgi:hypothetical protein
VVFLIALLAVSYLQAGTPIFFTKNFTNDNLIDDSRTNITWDPDVEEVHLAWRRAIMGTMSDAASLKISDRDGSLDVGTSILQNLDFSQDVQEHTVYSSIIVHF